MSKVFSNTSVGDKPADPYKKANLDTEASLKEKVDDLSDFITACKFGMMTTRNSSGSLVSRCMAIAAKETDGIDLLFHTNTESNKTNELATDPHVNVSFINPSGDWASVSGTSSIETDRALVKRHYSPLLKAWLGDLGDGRHDGGEDDPRIGVIRVKMTSATYAIVRKGMVRSAIEVAQSAVQGRPAVVNMLREISEGEVEEWRSAR